MIEWNAIEKNKNPFKFFKWIKYKIKFRRENPEYFDPSGTLVFTGVQGSSKSLSATLYVEKLMKMYPSCKLVTNLQLKNYPFDNERVYRFINNDDFKKYSNINGNKGVIFFIDEIQLYLNSLASKNINMDVIQVLSQQRKQRIHLVATSQVFGRLAKPLREQFSEVIVCKCFLGFISYLQVINRDSIEDNDNGTTLKGKVSKKCFFLHDPKYYELYDTYYVVEQNNFIAEEEKKQGIYDTDLQVSINNYERSEKKWPQLTTK